MAPRKKKPERPRPHPSPLVDPSEVVERILSRRQLLFEDGDVVIMRAAGLRSDTRSVYHLRLRGQGPLTARFVNFDHAAAAGDQLARARRVRLYYIDSDAVQEVPHLLKDYRPSAA